jgi:protein-disulfide isomerase
MWEMSMAKKKRKLTKAEARAEAQRQRKQRQMMLAVGAVVAAAVVIVLVLVVISGGRSAELVVVEPLRDDIETGVTAEGYPYRGSADALVTIEEYSDYNCPVCGEFNTGTAGAIDDELLANDQVKYVVKPYALWQESVPIVEAAVCATEQDKFWNFHHMLFANQALFSTQRPPSRGLLQQIAEAVGMDVTAFNQCLDEGREAQVLAVSENARTELGVTSTPTFFVNGVRTQLLRTEPYIDTLRKAVDTALAAEAPAGQ